MCDVFYSQYNTQGAAASRQQCSAAALYRLQRWRGGGSGRWLSGHKQLAPAPLYSWFSLPRGGTLYSAPSRGLASLLFSSLLTRAGNAPIISGIIASPGPQADVEGCSSLVLLAMVLAW
jgi:hypothetical protein